MKNPLYRCLNIVLFLVASACHAANLDYATYEERNLYDFSWGTGGDTSWFGQCDVSYPVSVSLGSFNHCSAQSGPVSHGQSSYIQATVTGPGTLSFYWKMAAAGNDRLSFYVDDVLRNSVSGDTDWSEYTYNIPEGSHILKWNYSGWLSTGEGTGWLDLVNFSEWSNLFVKSLGISSVKIGSASGHDGTTPYSKGVLDNTEINLLAPQMVGNGSFHTWYGCDDSIANSCSLNMLGDGIEERTVYAIYDDGKSPTTPLITYPTALDKSNANGSIFIDWLDSKVPDGGEVTYDLILESSNGNDYTVHGLTASSYIISSEINVASYSAVTVVAIDADGDQSSYSIPIIDLGSGSIPGILQGIILSDVNLSAITGAQVSLVGDDLVNADTVLGYVNLESDGSLTGQLYFNVESDRTFSLIVTAEGYVPLELTINSEANDFDLGEIILKVDEDGNGVADSDENNHSSRKVWKTILPYLLNQ